MCLTLDSVTRSDKPYSIEQENVLKFKVLVSHLEYRVFKTWLLPLLPAFTKEVRFKVYSIVWAEIESLRPGICQHLYQTVLLYNHVTHLNRKKWKYFITQPFRRFDEDALKHSINLWGQCGPIGKLPFALFQEFQNFKPSNLFCWNLFYFILVQIGKAYFL